MLLLVLEAALGLLTGLALALLLVLLVAMGMLAALHFPFSLNAYRLSVSEVRKPKRKPFSEHGNQLQKSISETANGNRFQNTQTETPPAIFKNMSAK